MSKKNNNQYVYKKSSFALMDMLKAKKLPGKVLKEVKSQHDTNIITKYHVNELAEALHPGNIEVVVKKIIVEDKDTKTFQFSSTKNTKMPFFRAGQYISIATEINKTMIARPYSISSSPYDATRRKFIAVTVKRVKDGFFSNFMLDKVKVGHKFIISSPEGDFYHDSIRDANHIIGIAGGSGITPFLSMAKAIVEGSEDFKLTILNGNRKKENVIFYNELKELESKSNGKVKVINVLSEQKLSGFEHGFINLNIIKKYMQDDTSIFMCGPKPMYKYVIKEIIPLKLKRRRIRIEASNQIGSPKNYQGYNNKKKEFKIKVNFYGKHFIIPALAEDTILVSLQKARIAAQSKCLSGECS